MFFGHIWGVLTPEPESYAGIGGIGAEFQETKKVFLKKKFLGPPNGENEPTCHSPDSPLKIGGEPILGPFSHMVCQGVDLDPPNILPKTPPPLPVKIQFYIPASSLPQESKYDRKTLNP